MKRRSFFTALAKAAAIVALAPQLAFRAKPLVASDPPPLNIDEIFDMVYPLHKYQRDVIEIFTDRLTAAKMQEAMVRFYESQKV